MKTTPHQVEPDTLEIYYSRPFAAFVLLVACVVTLWLASMAVRSLLSGHVVLVFSFVIVFAVCAIPVFSLFSAYLHAWSFKGPVVVFDAEGVTDVRQKHSFISWDDIGQISRGTGETIAYLCFEFRNTSVAKQHVPRPFLLGLIWRRARFLGDWNVNLRPLRCKYPEVLRAAKGFHQRSIRAKIVQMNRPQASGDSVGRQGGSN